MTPEVVRTQGAVLALGEIECLANELSSLMRMGIPLASGLRELAPGMRGNLSAFAAKLAQSLESGMDLSRALHEERARLPLFFKAVVDAGIRSGDPAIALKSIAETARRIDEHRRVEFHAFIYPIAVGVISVRLISFSLLRILPWHISLYTTEGTPLPWSLVWANSLATGLKSFGWAIPIVLFFMLALYWLRPISWRASRTSGNWLGIGATPSQRNIIACGRWSSMLEVLVLLLKRQVPLHESLELAASVALPRSSQAKVESLSQRLQAGQQLAEADFISADFPRAVASALGTPRKAEALIQVLRQLESEYRWRAHELRRRFNGPWLNTITIGVAGAFVLAYIVIAILPVVQVYYDVVNNNIN